MKIKSAKRGQKQSHQGVMSKIQQAADPKDFEQKINMI